MRTWFFATLWLVLIFVIIHYLPVKEWSQTLSDYALQQGTFGVLLFMIAFVLATVCLIPCAFLTFSAGVAYGWWGVPLVMISAIVGATLSYVLARFLLRDKVRRWLSRRTDTEALKETVEEGGWRTMLLLRLSPMVPFNVNNYFLGTVKIDYLPYILVMIAGTLPLTTLLVYLGSLGKGLDKVHPFQIAFLIAGVMATGFFVRRFFETRRHLLRNN